MRHKIHRSLVACHVRCGVLLALGLTARALDQAAAKSGHGQAPRFEVDPMWPKPLPNHWLLGKAIGVAVDARDHIWIVHRVGHCDAERSRAAQNPPTGTCCKPAPPILEFDVDGTLLRSWGGPVAGAPYDWPASNHGLFVDHKGIVWLGGNVGTDAHILKFTQDGKFVAQYGKPGTAQEQQRHRQLRPARKNLRRCARRTRRTSPMATRTSASSSSTPTPASSSATGARTATSPTTPTWARTIPTAPPAQQFRTPVHCSDLSDRQPRLRLRPAEQPAAGVHARRQVREGSVLLQEDAG